MSKPLLCVAVLCLLSVVTAVPSETTTSDVDVVHSVTPTKHVLEVPPAADKLKIHVDTVVSEDKADETFVEVDAKSQAKAKSKSKSKSQTGYGGGQDCDDSRRRRDDESPRKGDPDCSGFDCQHGMSRRRRSDDCQTPDACFPASALVETETRGAVEMKEVLLGERIQTADGFSEVSCPLCCAALTAPVYRYFSLPCATLLHAASVGKSPLPVTSSS